MDNTRCYTKNTFLIAFLFNDVTHKSSSVWLVKPKTLVTTTTMSSKNEFYPPWPVWCRVDSSASE